MPYKTGVVILDRAAIIMLIRDVALVAGQQMTVDVCGYLLPGQHKSAVNSFGDGPKRNIFAAAETKKAATSSGYRLFI